jgi:hypothetical protein
MPAMKVVAGQPSWRLANADVEVFVSRVGGQTAPATFYRGRGDIRPYSVAPWAREPRGSLPGILHALRGDFFCMPFGGNATPYRGERHLIHGEPAGAPWSLVSCSRSGDRTTLHLRLETKVRPGRVDKRVTLVDGHPALYLRHDVTRMRGPICYGHHAMLKFPDEPGSGIVSTSPFVHGQVFPDAFERPNQYGYQSLRPGASFDTLCRVPAIDGSLADLSRYPARRGYEDLVMLVNDETQPLAWTAVTFPGEGYVWFSLKNPLHLAGTILWISNGGRHYPPWSGRHVNVMGLEDVTAYFHYGLAESAGKNPFRERGFRTCLEMRPDRPLVIPYIMAVARIPRGFDRVMAVEDLRAEGRVALYSTSGAEVTVPLDTAFLDCDARCRDDAG